MRFISEWPIYRRIDDTVHCFGIVKLVEQNIFHLSDGEKQKIACALASSRKIMLLDEPTSGLDHAHMMETARLLKKLHAQGITILVVTHDSELIRACCTRQYRIQEHRL